MDAPTFCYSVNPSVVSVSRRPKRLVLTDRIAYAEAIEEWFVEKGLIGRYLPFIDRVKFMAKIKYLRSPQRDIKAWRSTFPEINRRVMHISRIPWPVRLGAGILTILPL